MAVKSDADLIYYFEFPSKAGLFSLPLSLSSNYVGLLDIFSPQSARRQNKVEIVSPSEAALESPDVRRRLRSSGGFQRKNKSRKREALMGNKKEKDRQRGECNERVIAEDAIPPYVA